MDFSPTLGGETRIGRDLDAAAAPSNLTVRPDVLSAEFESLGSSTDPTVAFARLLSATIPRFADGGEVEVAVALDEPTRISRGLARQDALHHETVPYTSPGRAGHPGYSGQLTWYWKSKADRDLRSAVAPLLIQVAKLSIERSRWNDLAEMAEADSAAVNLRLISTRPIHIAIGYLMSSKMLSETDAERELRSRATKNDSSIRQVAIDITAAPNGIRLPERSSDTADGDAIVTRLPSRHSPSDDTAEREEL